jgi:hypothetical protein
MSDIPESAKKFGWQSGDLHWQAEGEGDPLFTEEELDALLEANPDITEGGGEEDAQAAEAAAKLPHDEVDYEHPAQGPDHCRDCAHYRGQACAIVEDPIEPEDWCNRYTAKPAEDALLPVPLDPDLRTLAENANQSNIIQQIYQLQAERNRQRQWTQDDDDGWKSPRFEGKDKP